MKMNEYQELAARTDSHENGVNPLLMDLIERGIAEAMHDTCVDPLQYLDVIRHRIHDAVRPTWELMHAALGLAGEAGEFADVVKKHIGQGHPLDLTKSENELGDVQYYTAKGAREIGVTLEHVGRTNIEKLRKRYPEGFSVEKSINREESKA